MRKRYRLHILNSGRREVARDVDHALELATKHVRPGETWTITVTVGAGDPRTVFAGVGRRELEARAGLVDEAAG